ncbi:MAG: hypothetical protein ACYCZ2_17345 [Lutibacter sp.]
MKKFKFLAVMALLMIFGCSKDEVITTEQDSFSVEKNGQPVINGARPGSTTSEISRINFYSTSIKNGEFLTGCIPNYSITNTERKLLKTGTFKGTLKDFGKINSSLSGYTFSSCIEADIDSPPNYGEPKMYQLIAEGTISLGTRDNCSIRITGNVYPWYYTDIQFDGGLFIGTATTSSGTGKLKNFNKTFEIYSNGRINLTTGEIPLNIREPM